MPGFDPRKYHGRRMDEVVRSANGDIRSALEEGRAVYQLCLRQQNLPAHREGNLRMQLWQVEKQLGLHSRYFSQAGQDRYLNERIFSNKRDGTFVEIGGYDGWMGSNCVFFEKVLGWTGLVVEASPQLVRRIGETRSARVIHAAVSDRDGAAEFLEVTAGLTQMGGLDRPLSRRDVAEGTSRREALGDCCHRTLDAPGHAAPRPRAQEDRLLLGRCGRGRARRPRFPGLR